MTEIEINSRTIQLVKGDITLQNTDAIANAANTGLRGGGGVDGAIHRAGGPEIMRECRNFDGCPTGKAVITTGGKLKAKYVIHTPGPVYKGGNKGEPELLASCYRECLKIAAEKKLVSIAFPSLSTGIYGYPVDAAAEIALGEVADFLKNESSVKLIRFVLFDASTFSAYEKALQKLDPTV